MITLLETRLGMLFANHTLRSLVAMARTPPVMNRVNTLMSVREILEIIALYWRPFTTGQTDLQSNHDLHAGQTALRSDRAIHAGLTALRV